MKSRISNIWKSYRWYLLILAAGIFLGWVFFHSGRTGQPTGNEAVSDQEVHDHETEEGTIWTCSMHPQIRQDQPGKCPICGMDLIPVSEYVSEENEVHPDEIMLTESAAKLAEIQTVTVNMGSPVSEIFLQGKVQADERRIAELTARFGGRIEKLYISFTGENVSKGQKLASIYSPELITAQKELLEAASYKESRPSIYNAARAKLRLWDLTDEQINEIEQSEEPNIQFDILSPISGTVTKRKVALGDYVNVGTALFEVTDLSHVWIMFDAYESDLPWISRNDRITYTIQSIPDKVFGGRVTYIDPFIDPATRVAKVRVEQSNPGLLLKPEMFVNGQAESRVARSSSDILIPKSAILWTGKRAVVYVKNPDSEQPAFAYREIVLGPESGNYYVVAGGLNEGEEIAVNGVFKIDAAAQLAGKPSMMNPSGGMLSTGHNHGSMQMDNETTSMDQKKESGAIDPAFKTQLQAVYDSYIPMKNAFVASDAAKVRSEAGNVKRKLDAVDMEILSGDAHMKWMEYLDQLMKGISAIEDNDELEQQRVAFATFNDAFYQCLETFGIQKGTVYYQYCPMANGDQGAYWLSEIKDIRNPYFGDAMLSCGETRETLDF